MPKSLPTNSQVVIIGGGVIGCSIAYHLAKSGMKDIALLERKTLTCGTTWAAAGLVVEMRGTKELTRMTGYGLDLYSRLESETGQTTGFTRTGSLLIATNREREREYDRILSQSRTFGVEMERINTDELSRLWPIMNTADIIAAYYAPNDALVNPVDTAMALAIGARQAGAGIYEETEVLDFDIQNDRIRGVKTNQGDIRCETIVLCAGMWSRELARKMGVSIPLHAVEHMHFITQPMQGVQKCMPILRDQDGHLYYREEVGGLLIGAIEPVAKPYGTRGIPKDWQFQELGDDIEHLEPLMMNALQRVPALEHTEIRKFTTVPESFTIDNQYILGEAPGIRNVYVATGMNTSGLMCAAGVGLKMTEWITSGRPQHDIWELDVRRFYSWQNNRNFLSDRIMEMVGNAWANHWPYKQLTTARPVRCSVLHARLEKLGACFGQVAGWERPNWFAPEGITPDYEYSWGRQNWFEYAAAEHMAVRNAVGIYDLSSFANFMFEGRDALAVLQNVCANDMDVSLGKVVYTQMLNDKGGIEADITVTRLAPNKFFIVTGTPTGVRDFDHISRHISANAHAVLTDMTSALATLGIMGPRSRDVLSGLTLADLSNDAFAFASARFIELGYATPLAVRISFAGELGWEIYMPPDFAPAVFDALMDAGRDLGIQPVGFHAIDSLRLECGFRHWGADIGPDDTPWEAGLGFAVKLDKGEFIGREALLRQKEKGLRRKLVTFTVDDAEALIYHDEPIYRDGRLASCNTHGSYAHLLDCPIGMGYLENPEGITDAWILEANYEIEVEGQRVPAKVHLKPVYDPEGKRVRM
jgi:4-methylaminobutanoate oxidase (formaldehyde-forming)